METNLNALLISEQDVQSVFENNMEAAIDIVEKSFIKKINNDILLPDKISQVFDQETQNRINCMPATLISDKICGVKWVSVFPENPKDGIPNVKGTIILSELEHGTNLSIMDGTYITGIRTASVGAVAVKYLAVKNAAAIGFIGAGKEARRHLDMIKIVRPSLSVCYVSSRSDSTVDSFIDEESKKHPDIKFVNCGSCYRKAVENADIIVTATSTQQDLLKAAWIKKGSCYIHVGGWEDEYAVPEKADKIVCDNWECIKHRTQTISRMYKEGLLKDGDIYSDLENIISGKVCGRENDDEFIYFCSVGLGYIDVMFAKYTYEKCIENNKGTYFPL